VQAQGRQQQHLLAVQILAVAAAAAAARVHVVGSDKCISRLAAHRQVAVLPVHGQWMSQQSLVEAVVEAVVKFCQTQLRGVDGIDAMA
jgi:hypothetical protein